MLKHGFNKARTEGVSRFYRIWIEIKGRCQNKNRPHYKHYGGRGIKVEWSSFDDFKNDMLRSYNEHVSTHGVKNTSIERTDNDGNYAKANCRWATITEQRRNTRTTKWVTYKGKTKSLAEWSSILGIHYQTLHARLSTYGYSVEEAFERLRSTRPKATR